MMRVERYGSPQRAAWNAFVRASRNGTFLHERAFMEYHAERFTDHSLLFRDPGGALLAALPAHLSADELDSHSGLSFGGMISGNEMTVTRTVAAFEALLGHLRTLGVRRFVYRPAPHIYHRSPAEEDLYALGYLGARLVKRTPLAVLSPRHAVASQERRRRGLRKARGAALQVTESKDLEELALYWQLLSGVLEERYGSRPVHSLQEIARLKATFPSHIRLFTCLGAGALLAGVLVFESLQVARAQYIAASREGKRLAALDLLLCWLFEEVYAEKPFFDLGSSEAESWRLLNHGVLGYKESLGARTVIQDNYVLDVE